jgi:hypothetical protein
MDLDWISGHGPAPLPEIASWPSPLRTTSPPRLDNVVAPSACSWNSSTNQPDSSSLPNGQLSPPTFAHDVRRPYETVSNTELTLSHSSHTSSFETSDSSTDFAITLVKPRLAQGSAIVVIPRIETHVYLDIGLPSRSWNAIQLPFTKSVTSDDSSRIGERITPLLLVITVRGSTTQQECNRVCEQCEKRMGNSSGLIDFHGPTNILTPTGGMVQVHFTFSCYSRHHRKEDEQFVYVTVAQ